jgi:hypothetical protein
MGFGENTRLHLWEGIEASGLYSPFEDCVFDTEQIQWVAIQIWADARPEANKDVTFPALECESAPPGLETNDANISTPLSHNVSIVPALLIGLWESNGWGTSGRL